MADLNDAQSALTIKIVGSDNTGLETNYVAIDTNGRSTTKINDGDGNSLASSITTPIGTEQALITRNIPSGTQPVSIASVVKVVDGLGSTGVNGNLNLVTANTSYEAKVSTTRLTNRKSVTIQSVDGDMYWGYNSSVTSATGTLLYKNQTIEFACDPGSTFQVYLVSISGNKNARIAESI